MARMQDATEARFVRAEASYLARHAPSLAETADPAALEQAARLGLAGARRAGFDEPGQIRLYLRLMTSFGCHFDTDPQFTFLHPLLDPARELDAIERARLLYWHATLWVSRVHGPHRAHGIEAVTRVSELDTASLAEAGADLGARAADLLRLLHPRRADYLSDETIGLLSDRAAQDAGRHGLGGAAGAPLLLCLMFSFGHRISADPLYPWVHETLSDPALIGPDKTETLAVRTRSTVASMLRTFREAQR
jgi:hypothetical protein